MARSNSIRNQIASHERRNRLSLTARCGIDGRQRRNRTSHVDSIAALAVDGVESALCASGDTGFDEESVGVDSETCRHGDIREAHVSGRIQEIPQTVITSLASLLVLIAVDAAESVALSER